MFLLNLFTKLIFKECTFFMINHHMWGNPLALLPHILYWFNYKCSLMPINILFPFLVAKIRILFLFVKESTTK